MPIRRSRTAQTVGSTPLLGKQGQRLPGNALKNLRQENVTAAAVAVLGARLEFERPLAEKEPENAGVIQMLLVARILAREQNQGAPFPHATRMVDQMFHGQSDFVIGKFRDVFVNFLRCSFQIITPRLISSLKMLVAKFVCRADDWVKAIQSEKPEYNAQEDVLHLFSVPYSDPRFARGIHRRSEAPAERRLR